jgi:hypothetical protein
MKNPRRQSVFVGAKHMIELVRIFLSDMAKRDARHVGSEF